MENFIFGSKLTKIVLLSALAHFGFTFRVEIATYTSAAVIFANEKFKELTNIDAHDHGTANDLL